MVVFVILNYDFFSRCDRLFMFSKVSFEFEFRLVKAWSPFICKYFACQIWPGEYFASNLALSWWSQAINFVRPYLIHIAGFWIALCGISRWQLRGSNLRPWGMSPWATALHRSAKLSWLQGAIGMHAGRCTKSNKLQNRIEPTMLLFRGEFLALKDLNRDFVLDEACAFESSASSKLYYCRKRERLSSCTLTQTTPLQWFG